MRRRSWRSRNNSAAPRPSSILPPGAATTRNREQDNFFAAVAHGDTIKTETTPLHRGRKHMVWQTDITRGRQARAIVTQTQLVLPQSASDPASTISGFSFSPAPAERHARSGHAYIVAAAPARMARRHGSAEHRARVASCTSRPARHSGPPPWLATYALAASRALGKWVPALWRPILRFYSRFARGHVTARASGAPLFAAA